VKYKYTMANTYSQLYIQKPLAIYCMPDHTHLVIYLK